MFFSNSPDVNCVTDMWALPSFHFRAFSILRRNFLVWRKLFGPAMMLNFGEPTIYLLGLGFGLGAFIGSMSDMPYITFLASGIIASSAMTTASFEGMYSVYTRMDPQKTYDAMLATPLRVDDIMFGELLWSGVKSVISGVAILIVSFAIGATEHWQALWVIPVVFLAGICFAGPAIVMASLAHGYDFFNYYFVLVVTPMFVLCGVFYPISNLPEAMQSMVAFLPLTHAVELIRPLMAGDKPANIPLHVSVLASYALISFYFAVVLVRKRLLV